MEIRELQSALRQLEALYASGGARKQAESLSELIGAMDGHADQSVETFVEETKRKLGATSKSASKAAALSTDGEVVDRHVNRLFAAGTDRGHFDTAFTALKSDDSAKAPECSEIASVYKNRPTNGTYKYRFDSRAKALEFVYDTYLGRAEDDSKSSIIDRMTKWATG